MLREDVVAVVEQLVLMGYIVWPEDPDALVDAVHAGVKEQIR